MKLRWAGRVCLAAAVVIAAGGAIRQPEARGEVKAGTSTGRDWANWRGPKGDGVSSESGWTTKWPRGGPKRLWRAKVGVGYSAISVAGGRAYTLGNSGGKDTVFCFDAASGEVLWKYSYACPSGKSYRGPRSTPTVDGKRVYTTSREGDLLCLTADKGKRIWRKQLRKTYGVRPGKWAMAGSLVIVGGKVIVDVGIVLAFNKKSGKLLWKSKKAKAAYSTPAVFSRGTRRLLASFNASSLAILDLKNGRLLMTHPWKTPNGINIATPIVFDGKVFLSSGYKTGCTLVDISGKKAKELWRNKNMSNHCNSSVLYKGYLYGFNGNVGGGGALVCLELKTGEVKWSHKGLGTGSLMIADGKLVVLGERGDLLVAAASPEKFDVIAGAGKVLGGICWTMPVLSGGRIYCRNAGGDVVCVDVSGK